MEASGNIFLKRVAGAHVRLISLPYPRFLPSLGIFSTFASLYPITFLRLGIQSNLAVVNKK